ncbi:MAG: NTP transferase domain-containing protein [candidate division Zixibacteria bacterium]|nr:NTP transferase domain-containing protein [candidate division Zixibacteria bacterium]
MSTKRAAVILAAGKGKRMKSDLAKVLHPINGRPMIRVLLDELSKLKFDKTILVIGHQGEEIQKELADSAVEFVWQREQLGTGHAVQMAAEILSDFDGTTLVALGDVPFLSAATLENLFEIHQQSESAATCLSADFEDPSGYGRIVRIKDTDRLEAIVEHKEASPEILAIKEINSGTFCFDNQQLFKWLKEVKSDNAQSEYYLTDVIKLMHDNGLKVSVVKAENPDEVRGINSSEQLEELEQKFRNKP